MLPHHSSWLVGSWTAVTGSGAAVALWLSRDVLADVRELRRAGINGIRRKATYLCVAFIVTFAYTLAVFATIGVIVMYAGTARIAATVGFCSVALVMVATCLYWRHVRSYAKHNVVPPTIIVTGRVPE